MSDSPWNDFFEEPEVKVDRSSIILSNPIPTDNQDLGEYAYDYNGGDNFAETNMNNGDDYDANYSVPLEDDEPVDELRLKAVAKKTARKKSKNADLSKAFSQPDQGDDFPNVAIDPSYGDGDGTNEAGMIYNEKVRDRVPIWKQLLNLLSVSFSVILLPWMVYFLMISFTATHILHITKILPIDIFFGYMEILLGIAIAILFGIFWNGLSIFACRMWIRRFVLPAIYIITLLSLSAVVVFFVLAWATQYTAKFIFGILFLYILVLVLIIPVWILRFIRQEFMIRYFARRILVLMWNHKVAIPMVAIAALTQGFVCLLIFVFNAYWMYSIPVGLVAMEVIRNSLLFAICRMDRHFLEEKKSNATLSISYFLEATVVRMYWIVLASILSFLQPLIAAFRSVSLAIITLSVMYNYGVLFGIKILQRDVSPENQNKKAVITIVLGVIIGPLVIFLLILSYIAIVASVLAYIIFEFMLIFMSRGTIASMGFFQENWFLAVFRQIRTRLRGAFFTTHPLSEAGTLYEKMQCIVLKLIASISEVTEANNVLLYFSEMGSIISACICGVSAYWWIGKLAPTDEANMEVRKMYYPYYQGIIVCFAIGYIITGAVLQLVEAHIHTLNLSLKYHNKSFLAKFTRMKRRDLTLDGKKVEKVPEETQL